MKIEEINNARKALRWRIFFSLLLGILFLASAISLSGKIDKPHFDYCDSEKFDDWVKIDYYSSFHAPANCSSSYVIEKPIRVMGPAGFDYTPIHRITTLTPECSATNFDIRTYNSECGSFLGYYILTAAYFLMLSSAFLFLLLFCKGFLKYTALWFHLFRKNKE